MAAVSEAVPVVTSGGSTDAKAGTKANPAVKCEWIEIPRSGGVKMPQIGYGTWQSRGDPCYQGVLHALKCGIRHIDTASVYKNEDLVGKAIRDSGVPRKEVFVTSKL